MSVNQKQKSQRKSHKRQSSQNKNKDDMSIDEQQQPYLRNDLNNLFDNMTVSANFNLRKISEDRQNQSKKSSKGESVQIKLINLVSQTKPTRISLSYNNTKGLTENIMESSKKNSTIIGWNQQYEPKKGLLKVQNLNKLLKKNDTFAIAIANKEAVSMKKNIKENVGMSSTFQVQKINEENKVSQFSSTKYNMSRTQQNKQGIRSKIMSMSTKGVGAQRFSTQISRDDQRSLLKLKRSKRTQTEHNETSKIQQRKNNYNDLQKKFNKGGPLKFKHVENWLNNIIQEYCHDEYFDTSLASAALKKYYIDSNSLMSNGVDPSDVNRIYNSLFVYSIGFNNLLKQISKGNKQLVKNIWKVYSLMLEYCAAGSYETLVGEMERDKLRKVEELKMEIQKRQQIIQKNQELNQEKNLNMYKQLKRLKDQNFNLANERQILMEDFQQADQAFNQEVSLRLKFENSINEIFGVHKELENKHGRLFHDFQVKIQELQKASQKYFDQTKTAQKYKYELIQLKQKHNELKKINSHDKQHVEVLLIELSNTKESYFKTMKDFQQSKSIILERDRKLEQMITQMNNNKIILQLREKSAKQTHSEYQLTLEENNKLFAVISQQRLQMEALLKQKKQFNQNVLKILAQSSYYKKKYESTQNQIKEFNQKVIDAEQKVHKFEVKNDIFVKQIDNLKSDLQSNYESIRKMHAKNFDLQQELSYLRKFQGNADSIMEQKNVLIDQLRHKVDQLQTKLMQQTHEFMNLQSKFKILQTQLRTQKEISVRRIQEFKKQQQLMSTNQTSLSKVLKEAHFEVDKYRTALSNMLMDYKNQKFQRANLNLNYQQILKVLQNKNQQQKQASIKINQLQQEVLQYKEKYKLTKLNLLNTTDELTNKISHLNQKIKAQKQVLDHRAHHQHPMIFQDVCHKLMREIEQHIITKENYENQLYVKENNIRQAKKQIQQNIAKFKLQIQKHQEEFSKKQEKLRGQIEYEKQENKKAKNKLNALEILQATYKQKVSIYQQKEADQKRQQQLINQIQQKNTQIRKINQQILKITQEKQEQIKNLQKRIKQVENEKLDFVYQFKTKKEREIREQIEKKYQTLLQQMRQDFDEQIKKKRFKFSPRFNQFAPGSIQAVQYKNFVQQMVQNQSLDDLLQIKKEQFESKSEQQSRKFYDKIEEFFKKSFKYQDNQLSSRNNLFSISKNSTQKDYIKSLYKGNRDNIPAYLQKFENTSEQFKRRGSLARKLKNAQQYYGKI